jgi:hypothetical protein
MAEAEQRLSTLRTTQEARIALNEGIDAIVRGEDVNLSPNATEPLQRVVGEVGSSLKAQADALRAEIASLDHVAPVEMTKRLDALDAALQNDRPARLPSSASLNTPPAPTASDMARSSKVEDVPLSQARSTQSKMEMDRFNKGDHPPALISGYEDKPVAVRREDGEYLIFDGHHRAVTAMRQGHETMAMHVIDAKDYAPAFAGRKPAPPKWTSADDELLRELTAPTDAGGLSVGQRQESARLTRTAAVDTTRPAPALRPDGIKQAEASVAKPEDIKALAAQHSVDPATGAFPEEAEVAQLATEGRLTPDDAATLAQAEADYHTGSAFAEALKSVVGCLI